MLVIALSEVVHERGDNERPGESNSCFISSWEGETVGDEVASGTSR